MNQEEKEVNINDEGNPDIEPNYNFKWMLILLLVGIVGSFIFASFMK